MSIKNTTIIEGSSYKWIYSNSLGAKESRGQNMLVLETSERAHTLEDIRINVSSSLYGISLQIQWSSHTELARGSRNEDELT